MGKCLVSLWGNGHESGVIGGFLFFLNTVQPKPASLAGEHIFINGTPECRFHFFCAPAFERDHAVDVQDTTGKEHVFGVEFDQRLKAFVEQYIVHVLISGGCAGWVA